MAASGFKTLEVTVRLARIEDASPIAQLSAQLGYPVASEDVEQRITQLNQTADSVVYVAEVHDGHVVGWIHAFVCRTIESDSRAEIGGLVVDERHRRSGAGRLLMQHAEKWARERGCKAVNLRTNVVRKDAHNFYQSLGYNLVKTQHAFRKNL